MYCVKIMYPRRPGSSFVFNLKHWLDVHMPLGLGLFREQFGFSPLRVDCDVNCTGSGDEQAKYYVVSSLYFNNKNEADCFSKLFAIPEIAAKLKADWPNYTELDPEVVFSEIIDVDPVSGMRISKGN
ncbi:MAG: EthD family reductase [Candidatus Binataceae bacterium]